MRDLSAQEVNNTALRLAFAIVRILDPQLHPGAQIQPPTAHRIRFGSLHQSNRMTARQHPQHKRQSAQTDLQLGYCNNRWTCAMQARFVIHTRNAVLTWTCVVAGWVLTLLSTVVVGRLVGLCVTAACGAAMAYFAMPPVFSFQVTEPADVATLGAYGVVGFFILRKGPARHSRFARWLPREAPREMPGTDLSLALEDVLES